MSTPSSPRPARFRFWLVLFLCLAPISALFGSTAHAETRGETQGDEPVLDGRIVLVAPADGEAVLRLGADLHAVSVGDDWPGTHHEILSIVADRIVVELSSQRQAWVFPRKGSTEQRIQVFDRERPGARTERESAKAEEPKR